MKKRKILVVGDYDGIASRLKERLEEHIVEETKDVRQAIMLEKADNYDVVVTDLDTPGFSPDYKEGRNLVQYFKINAKNFKRQDFFDEKQLKDLFKRILEEKSKLMDERQNHSSERVEFVFPSTVFVIDLIAEYLTKRVEKMNIVNPDKSNLFVALDEAIVNAVKHGNRFDKNKVVRITAEISPVEADFTIEDEGEGFDTTAISDPTLTENMMKPDGRGILIIKKVMDEVIYDSKGNRLRMVKRLER